MTTSGGGDYDVLVVGGGHAGIEAALTAARMGTRAALVTLDRRAIGRMSCNPAIGGLGKGQIVREIDALGGEMAKATDDCGIQFRMLNTRKGPAVQAPRAQCDKHLYQERMVRVCGSTPGLDVIEGQVLEVLAEPAGNASSGASWRLSGVLLADGSRVRCRAVIITSGTFLSGLLHCGAEQKSGGRIGEAAATGLSACLEKLGFERGRLKTGTPPRVEASTVDWSQTTIQPGDDPPVPFSHFTKRIPLPQVPCHIAYTNEATHAVIRENLHRSPMYSGAIVGVGPRYCPSIEDKVVRFAEKDRHQLFLEPEGLSSSWIYLNGISTSLPRDVQDAMVKSIPRWDARGFSSTATPWNMTSFRRRRSRLRSRRSSSRGSISPARSAARVGTKKQQVRAFSPVSTPSSSCARGNRSSSIARRRISASSSTTS
jgi:tRNA uridine 5-carboxymethylaminomethyl modification enzyme